jgi:type I restriction enzyme S subunit
MVSRDLVFTINKEDVPPSWTLATISALVGKQGVFVDGDWVESKDQDPNGDVRLIQLADIGDGVYKNKSQRFLTQKKAIELGCTFLKKGDVLVARMPDPLGRACIFPGDVKKSVTVVDVAIVRPKDEDFDTRWLMYFINAPIFRNTVASMESGSTRKRISRKNLSKILLPVPPDNIQKLIVSEIEKQFSRLDEAVAALKRIKANLKRYKASVLKAAVEGKLTEEWRKEHPDVEPASELLKRILVERRRKWEKQHPAKKYKEPAEPDTSNLPELPKGWGWANIEQLSEAIPNAIKAGPFGSSLKKSFYIPKGYKIYGQEQVLRDDPYYGDYYIDEERFRDLSSCAVKPGDILISLVGTIGRVLILPNDIEPGIINPRLAKLSLDNRLIGAKFFKAYLQSPYVKYLFSLASHGGTMDILNLTILKEIPIPLPPIEEQIMILEELDSISSIEKGLELEVETSIKRAERLRQSILKKAFEGKLI